MQYLQPTYYFDFEHELIQDLVREFQSEELSEKEKAVGLYVKVRDGWSYDPYTIHLSPEKMRASFIATRSTGHCIEKSVVLIAGLRALDIPARLHLGKVRNHIAVEKLIEKIGSDELTPHGMVNVFLNGEWLKLSPAFNKELCEKFNVEPLEFDGENNSFLQQYNSSGSRFMEYLEDYGHFEDLPVDFIKQNLKEHYGHLIKGQEGQTEFNWK
jgi:transglutaminase-like putative cysteine protease